MTSLPLASLLREKPLTRMVTCANCWHTFRPESVRWIAVHKSLIGEPQLDGLVAASQRRFIPERFDVEGRALDAEGAPCTKLACPRCLLQIPRASLEMPSVVLSLLGSQGSGKSVFLTSMIYSMRQSAASLGLRFHDAETTLNKGLIDDEESMFLDAAAESARPIREAVKKTKVDDHRHRTSRIDGHDAKFVPPYTFLLAPSDGHPRQGEGGRLARLLCLYDNAGEHFRPGEDVAEMPLTRHLAASKGIMYTFDPTKDRRVRRRLEAMGGAPPAVDPTVGVDRQDIVLFEAANRIREHAGLAQTSQIPQTLVVVLTKFDVWRGLVPGVPDHSPLTTYPGTKIDALWWDRVERVSTACRQFLQDLCPDIVAAAKSVSDNVIYVPVAAVGWDVHVEPATGAPSFVAATCRPHGVLVPLLCLLSKHVPKLVPSLRDSAN